MVDSVEGSEEASAWWAVQWVVFQLFSIGVEQFLSECQNRHYFIDKERGVFRRVEQIGDLQSALKTCIGKPCAAR